MQQTHEAGLTFDECADCWLLVFADNEIPFPVPGLAAVVGRERSLVDRRHRLFEPGAATVDALLGAAVIAVGAQRRAMLRCERRRPRQRRSRPVDGLVNALVTQPHLRSIREPLAQVTADLLRAPPLREQLANHPLQLHVHFDAPAMVARSPSGRTPVRIERAIALRRDGVAAQFTWDRWRRPTEAASDLTPAHASAVQISELDPLVLRQEPGADLAYLESVKRWDNPTTWPARLVR